MKWFHRKESESSLVYLIPMNNAMDNVNMINMNNVAER